eukprot:2156689-Amphidinium_carterae.1
MNSHSNSHHPATSLSLGVLGVAHKTLRKKSLKSQRWLLDRANHFGLLRAPSLIREGHKAMCYCRLLDVLNAADTAILKPIENSKTMTYQIQPPPKSDYE